MSECKREFRFDLDGVLADFDAFFLSEFGITCDEMEAQKGSQAFWDAVLGIDGFFKKLKMTPYAEELLGTAEELFGKTHNFSILTAVPRTTTYPTAAEEKEWWVRNVLKRNDLTVNIGPYSRNKQKWAQPGDILLDDRDLNIIQWRNKGGIGIFHSYRHDYKLTISQMKQIARMINV